MELVLVRDLSPFNLPLLSRELFALFTRARERESEREHGTIDSAWTSARKIREK